MTFKKLVQRFFASLALACLLLVPVSAHHAAAYDVFEGFKNKSACSGGAKDSVVCTTDNKDNISGPTGVLRKVTSIIAVLSGVVAVILIVVAGFNFVTSGGDSNKVASARSALMGALVGVLIVLLAQALLLFVIKAT